MVYYSNGNGTQSSLADIRTAYTCVYNNIYCRINSTNLISKNTNYGLSLDSVLLVAFLLLSVVLSLIPLPTVHIHIHGNCNIPNFTIPVISIDGCVVYHIKYAILNILSKAPWCAVKYKRGELLWLI